jgi:putative MATE family efflux protein
VIFLLISLAMGVSVGTTALVARFKGADDSESGVQATGQSLSLSFLCAVVFGTLFYIGRFHLIGLLMDGSHNAAAASLCIRFVSIALIAVVPVFMTNVLMGAFRGLGDTRTPMLIMLATIATHIGLNSVLIYGRLGFPRLEVAGAAAAFATSQFVGLTLYLYCLRRSPLGGALTAEHLRLNPEWAWRIFRIGLPAAFQAVIRQLGMMSFTGMLARTVEGTASVAALQIGIRAESIAFMPGFGYSVAASTLVGQGLGAKDVERAERSAKAATFQAILIMSAMALLFFTLAHQLTAVFTHDGAVRMLGTDYLRVNAICEPFLALGVVLTGALQGAGDTIRPAYITILTMWVVRLPLGYLLMFVLHLNTHGAWIAMSSTTILGGLMTVGLFRAGTWKRIKV